MSTRVLVVAALLLAAVADANAAADAETQSAKTHYSQAMKHYNLGDYRTALEEFKAAYLAKPDAAFLFNIGQCQRQLADYPAAEKSYRAFLRESPELPALRREQVQRLIAEMEKAQIEARANQPPTGTQPPRDESEAHATTPPPAAPAAGPSAAPAPSDGGAAVHPGRTKMIVGLVVGVAGLGLVGGGVACGVLAQQAGDELTALDRSGGQFDRSKEQAGKLDQTLSGVLLGVGAAAVVTGVIVGALGIKERKQATRASLAPMLSPTSAGALVTVTY